MVIIMNIRIPYIMNPIHEGKYSTTIITKNGKIKKKANIRYRGFTIRPINVIYDDDIFA